MVTAATKLKDYLLLGRKAMTNLDSSLKGRDIPLLRKVCIVKAVVFPVVMCRCESWDHKEGYVAIWIGGEFGKEWIHIYVWLSPFAVHLKLSNTVNLLYSNIKELKNN